MAKSGGATKHRGIPTDGFSIAVLFLLGVSEPEASPSITHVCLYTFIFPYGVVTGESSLQSQISRVVDVAAGLMTEGSDNFALSDLQVF